MGYTDLKCLDPVMIVTSKNVPDEVVEKINEIMVKVFSDQELKDYMMKEGTIIDPFDFAKSQMCIRDRFARTRNNREFVEMSKKMRFF